jgi:hypothetical protein
LMRWYLSVKFRFCFVHCVVCFASGVQALSEHEGGPEWPAGHNTLYITVYMKRFGIMFL